MQGRYSLKNLSERVDFSNAICAGAKSHDHGGESDILQACLAEGVRYRG